MSDRTNAQRQHALRQRQRQLRVFLNATHENKLQRIKRHHGINTDSDTIRLLLDDEASRLFSCELLQKQQKKHRFIALDAKENSHDLLQIRHIEENNRCVR